MPSIGCVSYDTHACTLEEDGRPTFRLAAKDHAADDPAAGEAAAHDLDDADVVDVEVFRVRGHDGERGLRDEVRQLVLVAVLF